MSTLRNWVFAVASLLTAASAHAVLVITDGELKKDARHPTFSSPAGLRGTGSVCVSVIAGTDKKDANPKKEGFVQCIALEAKPKPVFEIGPPFTKREVIAHAGLGRNKPKFVNPPGTDPEDPLDPTKAVGNKDSFTNASTKTRSTGRLVLGETTAKGTAKWESFVTRGAGGRITKLEAKNEVRAEVKKKDDHFSPPGRAVAESEDPIETLFDEFGSFEFDAALESIALSSDDRRGRNHLDVMQSFSNVAYMGQSLDGILFTLVLESRGILTSPNDLTISFLPWQGLGLSVLDVESYIEYIRTGLTTLSDGSIGTPPGSSLPLFGGGSPLPTLVLEHDVGWVTSAHSITALAASVPEPSMALIAVAGVIAFVIGRRSV